MSTESPTPPAEFAPLPTRCEVLIVGAGFGGIYALHRLRGLGFDAHVVEAGGGVGGTWYWNRYPGARCDVPSVQYSYSFDEDLQQDWVWTERYAAQPEILAYIEHVVDRFDLASGITLNTRVAAADLDESGTSWTVRTDSGAVVQAKFLIAAVGGLSSPQIPDLPGIESFQGEIHHPGAWPHDGVDLAGKRVGIIGTGSSGVQMIPLVAQEADHLTVFQRTPCYSIPAGNRPLTEEELAQVKATYPELRQAGLRASNSQVYPTEGRPMLADPPELRQEVLRRYWADGGLGIARAYTDTSTDPVAGEYLSQFIRDRIADIVSDPDKREALTPRSFPFNGRRPTLDTNYYRTFNLPHVDLVDVRAHPITGLTPTGLRTDEAEYDLDLIVFATGYDAMTGSLFRLNVSGRDGRNLRDAWADGPQTFLGLAVHQFPNFFVIAGPGSPSVLATVVLAIEQQVEWLGDLLVHARTVGADSIEATPDAQEDWMHEVRTAYEKSAFNGVDSWYVGANIPGKPRVILPYAGGATTYRAVCDEVAAQGYRGLRLASVVQPSTNA
ncbi:flavin-containing monooxygenase [Sporichthya polymorpha]|uniref:flavin-containing monooxygenase n=1 Tax=Sporichthya polymorpha TaxID=35751 RepID=UPI00037C13DB|nr:NAD(P)/FAD-dependent oxidoreductase [Sporichthya polymorpha]